VLGANVDPYNPSAQAMLAQLKAAFLAAGADVTTATSRAYGALFGMVQRQAAIVSFVEIFRLLGLMFLLLIPLVFLMKRPGKHGAPVAAH
jgi:MFS transporter, DHA2 family, multidrug resistance protein